MVDAPLRRLRCSALSWRFRPCHIGGWALTSSSNGPTSAEGATSRDGRHPADVKAIAVLASGAGSNLAALMAAIDADPTFPARIAVVGSDQPHAGALTLARDAGIATVVHPLAAGTDRDLWEAALVDDLAGHAVDVVVLAGFMRIVTSRMLDRWPNRVVNTHPSLLPAFRGAHAVRDALAHGVKVTGATVHLVWPELDAGPIIAQQAVPVLEGDDQASLHDRIRQAEHQMLPRCVRWLCENRVHVEGRSVTVQQ